MSTTQKSLKAYLFIDYIPAEFRENKRWEVIYYVKNPFSKTMVRKSARVKPLHSITERRKLARKMVVNINKELERGWNPFKTEDNAAIFKKLIPEMDAFLKRKTAEVKKDNLRFDTLRSYKSFVNNIKVYLRENLQDDLTIFDFNTFYISEFLDYLYYEKQNSSRTRNNYLSFIKTLFAYFKARKYTGVNPADAIAPIKHTKKEKQIISRTVRNQIHTYLANDNPNYLTLCLACYYCLIRRTELTKIRVGDVVLRQGIIYIKNEYSKNKKTQAVTIPDYYIPYLIKHIASAKNSDFLFSAANFAPGQRALKPKKISDQWSKMKKEIDIPKHIVWYHLKDTGITELLLNGTATIKVRDQARHHSIVQTEEYTPKEIIKAVGEIQHNNKKF